MAFKKVLVGLGIVCLLAPLAALARGNGPDFVHRAAADAMSALGLTGLLGEAKQADEQETPLAARRADELGSRVSRMLIQDFAGLPLTVADEEAEFSEDDSIAAASGGVGGAVATRSARQTGLRAPASGQSGGSFTGGAGTNLSGVGGAANAAAVGGGGGSGVGGSGDANSALAANEAGAPGASPRVGPEDAVLTAVPVPASVWMLLASIAGFVIVGRRRRSRSF